MMGCSSALVILGFVLFFFLVVFVGIFVFLPVLEVIGRYLELKAQIWTGERKG